MIDHFAQDIEIVKIYLAGDRRMENALYASLRKQIEGLIAHMEGRGARFLDRDNLVSDIIYQIMIKDDRKILTTFDGRSKLSTYLWPIIRCRIIDAIRRERRYNDHMVRQEDAEIADSDPEAGMVETIVTELIAGESEQDRFIKYAKWLSEMSYAEIIQEAQREFPDQPRIQPAHIAYILHDNRKKLQKKLQKLAGTID